MIEKEIFPQLAQEGELYAYTLENTFWYDIGKPSDYIKGQGSYLEFYDKTISIQNSLISGHNLID